jgi:small-conductance mechanosensitive channel
MMPLQLDWLPGMFPTLAGRIGVSIGIVLALVVIALGFRMMSRWVAPTSYARYVNAALVFVLLGVILSAGGSILILWEISVLPVLGDPVLFVTRLVFTVLLAIATYLLIGAVHRAITEFSEDRSSITRHQEEMVFRLTQVSLYGFAVIVMFGIWSIDLSGLLVGAGFLGIVVGLAARQTLGSLIAGFVLMFARPFEIGDWVKIGDREGIVTEISIVNTRIQTFDGEYVMVPNDNVGSSEIVNRTRKGRLRIKVEVSVDYSTDLDHAIDIARSAMRDVDEILSVPQPQVVIKEFGASAITLELRFWIDKPSSRRRWRARTAVISTVKQAFDQGGIKIPFPQRELMSRMEEGGFRLTDDRPGETVPSSALDPTDE